MRPNFLMVSVLTLLFPFAVWSADPKVEELNGTWSPESAEMAGQALPEEARKSIKLVIKDDKYTVTIGQKVDEGTAKTDSSAKPKTLDVVGTNGPNKGRTLLAIYELEGDTLKVCYDLSGKVRPTEFQSKAGTQLFLVTYKRAKS